MRLVAPFGFYGFGNIGDEATLSGFARLSSQMRPRLRVFVGSRDPRHTARAEPAFAYFAAKGLDPRRWWAKMTGSAHAVLGGTPIQDGLGDWPLSEIVPIVRAIDRWKVPMSFVGVGIEGLRSDESRRLVIDAIVPRVRHWSVRSDRDRDRLLELGVSPDGVTVAADMAWLIEPATAEFGRMHLQRCGVDLRRPLVGVNVVNENGIFDHNQSFLDGLAAALDGLTREDATVVFLAQEIRDEPGFDRAAAIRVMSRMTRAENAIIVPNQYFSPNQMMSIIACCRQTISMRYHFCLFSALQRVPFVAIERSDKLRDLSWDLDWEGRRAIDGMTAQNLVELSNRVRLQTGLDRLGERIEAMQARSRRNAAALQALGAV